MRTVRPKSQRSSWLRLISAFLVAMISTALSAPYSFAQSIVINDCNGFTRAVKQTDAGQVNKVEVQVSTASNAPATTGTVQLTNVISGQIQTASVSNGIASFDGVGPGVYSLASTEEGLKIGTMWITGTSASAALATGVGIAAGIAAGGAATGVVIGVDSIVESSNGGGGDDGNNPGPPIQPTPPPNPTPGPQPTPTNTPCPVCNPDAEPTPIDDFFKAASATPIPQQATILSPYR